jgi:hypothetical protein
VRQLSHDLSDPLEEMFKERMFKDVTLPASVPSGGSSLVRLCFLFAATLASGFFSLPFSLFWEDGLGPPERGTVTFSIPAVARSATSAVRSATSLAIAGFGGGYGPAESETDISSISAVATAARPVATRADSMVAALPAVPDQGHGGGQGGGYTGGYQGGQQQSGARTKLWTRLVLLKRHGLLSRRSSTVHPSFPTNPDSCAPPPDQCGRRTVRSGIRLHQTRWP